MKRPFCILTLSDLHLIGNNETDTLENLQKSVFGFVEESPQWTHPDYLLIAGDMIDASKAKGIEESVYNNVKGIIQKIISSFNIPPFNVIITPGNHDKHFPSIPNNLSEEDKRKACSQEYQKYLSFEENVNRNGIIDFEADFDSSFDYFGKFYEGFTYPGDNEELLLPSQFHNNRSPSALTSCLKVFHNNKACFLSVNTEWTGFPRSISDSLSKDEKKRLNSLPRICRPFIYEQLKGVGTEYSDYTLITVMHRNPAELSWSEQAAAVKDKPDTLQFIYHYSDIIFSGHNHIRHILTPDLLGNRVQSFQLGSSSMEDRTWEWRNLNAGLVLVDSISHLIHFQEFHYDNLSGEWETDKGRDNQRCYPLIQKHLNPDICVESLPNVNNNSIDSNVILTIRANSLEPKDVREAYLKQVTGLDELGYKEVKCINIDLDNYREEFVSALSVRKPSDKVLFILYGSSWIEQLVASQSSLRFRELRDLLVQSSPQDYYKGLLSIYQISVQARYIGKYDLS